MAVRTGLEPATPGVTGRYSDQLNYRTTSLLCQAPGSVLLSHGDAPHYHRRCGFSLLSSAWGQVGPPRSRRQAYSFFRHRHSKHFRCCKVKSHGSLVPVSSMHRCTYTSGLSTSSSRTCLQVTPVTGMTHLGAGFPLRCFQRLSLPHLATGQCHWRDNPYTSDASTPVLSYWKQPPSIFLRPRQIGTELSHDVLNPARVPL